MIMPACQPPCPPPPLPRPLAPFPPASARSYLLFHKVVLDRACKDKSCKEFEPDFKLEIFLDEVEEREGEFAKLQQQGTYLHDDVDEGGDDDEKEEAPEK